MRQLKTSQVCSLFFRPLAQHYPGVGDSPLVYRSSPILAEESKQVGKYRIGQVRQVRIGRCPSFFFFAKRQKSFCPTHLLMLSQDQPTIFFKICLQHQHKCINFGSIYLFLLHFFYLVLAALFRKRNAFFCDIFFARTHWGNFLFFSHY